LENLGEFAADALLVFGVPRRGVLSLLAALFAAASNSSRLRAKLELDSLLANCAGKSAITFGSATAVLLMLRFKRKDKCAVEDGPTADLPGLVGLCFCSSRGLSPLP